MPDTVGDLLVEENVNFIEKNRNLAENIGLDRKCGRRPRGGGFMGLVWVGCGLDWVWFGAACNIPRGCQLEKITRLNPIRRLFCYEP